MPLKEGATVEDVLRVVIDTVNTMVDGYRRPGDSHNEQAAIGISNTGYFIFRALGFSDEETRQAFRRASRQQEKSKIVAVEPTDDPNSFRVFFEGGGSVLVRSTRAATAGYWLDGPGNQANP